MQEIRIQQVNDDTVLEVTEVLPVKQRHSEKRLLEQRAYFQAMVTKGQEGLDRVDALLAQIENERTNP